ncbi:MAG: hypothetical protein VW778_07820 [Betaproteobacteria bacterium]|jgi:hypothetical protein
MKKIIATVGLLVATTTHAESIDQLLTDGYEIKSAATVAAGGMYFILQKGAAAYFCPALDPSRVMTCRQVKGEVSETR